MKKAEIKRVLVFMAIIAMCSVISFFIGRSTIDIKSITKIEKGETISGSVSPSQFVPIKEEKPEISILYRDTGSVRYVNLPADTAGIIADYELKRTYQLTAFDNKTQGKLELFPVIQYNRLTGLDYNFTPMIKTNYIYKDKVWHPFVSGSYSTLGYVGIGGGIFYHNIGVEYQYQIDYRNRNTGHLIGGKWMF